MNQKIKIITILTQPIGTKVQNKISLDKEGCNNTILMSLSQLNIKNANTLLNFQ